MQVAIFEKVIKYMPVADDTLGGTPNLRRRGLNMTPPPRPKAPATHPPPKPSPRTRHSVFPSKKRSLSTKLRSCPYSGFLYFFFIFYSLATSFVEKKTIVSITIKKTESEIQSPALHFLKAILDLPPRKKLKVIRKASPIRLIICLAHCP